MSNNRKITAGVFLALMITVFFACKKKDDGGDEPNMVDFDRAAMQKDIADKVILPANKSFETETIALQTTLNNLLNNTNTSTLETAQTQWRVTANAWEHCSLFNIGRIKDDYIHNKIYTWPANEEFINTFIQSTDVLDNAYISSKGSSSKGLAAMEYLLFSEEGNQAILDSLTNNAYAQRKKEYLKALGDNLHTIASLLNYTWSQTGSDYYTTFVSSKGTGVNTSTNILINEMANLIETMLNTKIGKPMGKHLDNVPNVTLLESYRAKESLSFLLSNLASLRATFTGGTGVGVDDYLDAVGAMYDDEKLSAHVLQQMTTVQTALNKLQPNLYTSLTTRPQDMEQAHQELKALLVLFKVDIVSNLSITLTLNDNDGD